MDSVTYYDRMHQGSSSPMPSPIIGGIGLGSWKGIQQERFVLPRGMSMDWQGAPASPGSNFVKKILSLEIPVDSYPNFNFVGRLLGPRGNSLKRVEASTDCRVYIRGKGSIKNPGKGALELKSQDEVDDAWNFKKKTLFVLMKEKF